MSGERFEDDVRILIKDYFSGLPEDHHPVDHAINRLDAILNDDDGNPVEGGRWLSSEQVAKVRGLATFVLHTCGVFAMKDARAVLALLDAAKEDK